ncbi:hypothetical protein DSCO28_20740 [Desulfosarcina ovata subsp. sediminis]|uniref:Uncharacterized protein n=1 Tax=Desulfosarcina ovata subsp. sediminis TaxID=885957 RepID=A0A5K7ZH30_9BACT|nr:hypothetical protein [Desulfosarcina ovata]BBO81508.1 hypothetical protein DSCO28_20740 [Desulfosarcina ovata subsp. sediminis]
MTHEGIGYYVSRINLSKPNGYYLVSATLSTSDNKKFSATTTKSEELVVPSPYKEVHATIPVKNDISKTGQTWKYPHITFQISINDTNKTKFYFKHTVTASINSVVSTSWGSGINQTPLPYESWFGWYIGLLKGMDEIKYIFQPTTYGVAVPTPPKVNTVVAGNGTGTYVFKPGGWGS